MTHGGAALRGALIVAIAVCGYVSGLWPGVSPLCRASWGVATVALTALRGYIDTSWADSKRAAAPEGPAQKGNDHA